MEADLKESSSLHFCHSRLHKNERHNQSRSGQEHCLAVSLPFLSSQLRRQAFRSWSSLLRHSNFSWLVPRCQTLGLRQLRKLPYPERILWRESDDYRDDQLHESLDSGFLTWALAFAFDLLVQLVSAHISSCSLAWKRLATMFQANNLCISALSSYDSCCC